MEGSSSKGKAIQVGKGKEELPNPPCYYPSLTRPGGGSEKGGGGSPTGKQKEVFEIEYEDGLMERLLEGDD
nr:ethylene-responsive transcription factor ERF098-like [Ipomoea batatas]